MTVVILGARVDWGSGGGEVNSYFPRIKLVGSFIPYSAAKALEKKGTLGPCTRVRAVKKRDRERKREKGKTLRRTPFFHSFKDPFFPFLTWPLICNGTRPEDRNRTPHATPAFENASAPIGYLGLCGKVSF